MPPVTLRRGFLRRAVIGLGGKGRGQVKQIPAQHEVRLTALCEVDPGHSVLVENRNLPVGSGQKAMVQFRGIRECFTLNCEGGSFVGLKGGGGISDREGKRMKQFPGAAAALDQLSLHLAGNQLDPAPARFVLGPTLELDSASGEVSGLKGGDSAQLAHPRELGRGSHRAPYGFAARA